MSYRKKVILLILIATLVRCVLALSLNLGNDEVYYLSYAQHLQWNYFDHPPMVALLIRLTTLDLNFVNDFSVRFGAIVLSAINTFLIYRIGVNIKDEKTGYIASLLFTSSFYSSIIAGLFILPDTSQLFFWIVSIYILLQILSKNSLYSQRVLLLLFGITVGLCTMSKIHGIFLWFGFGLYILFFERKILVSPYLYLAILLTFLIVSPIVIWNISNDFITYKFHGDRVAINSRVNFTSFFRELLGGLFYNNPINYFIIILGLIGFFKNKIMISLFVKRLLLLVGLPLILILLFLSLFRDTLPHWSGPGYVSLSILAAVYIAENDKLDKWVRYSNFFILLVAILGMLMINFYPGTIGKHNQENLGENDFTLDMYNWSFFKEEIQKKIMNDHIEGITKTRFIINNKWFPGSHIDNYIAQPLGLDFLMLGDLNDIHTYKWLNAVRSQLKKGDDAYFITTSNNFTSPKILYKEKFATIKSPYIIRQFRNGKAVRQMYVYLLLNYKP